MSDLQYSRRTKKKKKNKLSLSKNIGMIAIIVMVIIFGSLLGTVLAFIATAPKLDSDVFSLNQSSVVYGTNEKGEYVPVTNIYGAENRLWVPLDKIPKNVQNAFIAIEDERFRYHHGIDFKGIFRAAFTNLIHGKITAGGSTITQQLVKNTLLTQERTFKRKIQEAYLAYKLEQKYSKDQILEAYLNTIYLGPHTYGVQAAALTYFGKDVSELNLAEAAFIAGITKNPAQYSPFSKYSTPEKIKERQLTVLQKMLELNFITKEEYELAKDKPLEFKTENIKTAYKYPYFVDQLIEDISNDLVAKYGMTKDEAENKLFNGGLKIYSTLDVKVQEAIEKAFDNPKLFPATITDINGVIQPQAAMVIIDYRTGEIKGLVGGRGYSGQRTLNRVTQARRQPGSSIKPITVYVPALDKGYTPATVIDDIPLTVNQPTGDWVVHNYDNEYWGLTPIRTAVQFSRNIPAVKIVMNIGVDTSASYAEKFGLKVSPNDRYLAPMALGGWNQGVTPLELAAAYGTIANGGIYVKPITYTKVEDKDGKILLENKPEKKVVISEQVAYVMTDLLKTVVNAGTGTKARINMPAAGKTGTTTNYKDAWFVGYTPYYVGAIWMGYDKGKEMKNVTGGTYPAALWGQVMGEIHKNLPYKDFTMPDGIVTAAVCKDSGLLPTDLCNRDPRGSRVVNEIFISGTVPTAPCNVHVEAQIDTSTGLLATPYCPPGLVQTKVFIDPPGRPEGVKTRDSDYVVPKKECNVHTGEQQTPPTGTNNVIDQINNLINNNH